MSSAACFVCSATCQSAVVAPITASPLRLTHRFRTNNVALNVSVVGTDVIGACVDPTRPTSVDSCTADTRMTVSSSPCSYPNIVIVDRTPLFASPRVVRRSVQLHLLAVVNIDCSTTLRNTKVVLISPSFCVYV